MEPFGSQEGVCCLSISAKYQIYNLCVESDVALTGVPELPSSFSPDLVARIGGLSLDPHTHPSFPAQCDSYSKSEWWVFAPSATHILFNCYAGAFEIIDGNRINIMPDPDATPEKIRTFLMGSALGAAQIQRGRIPLHGGAIVVDNKAMVLTGKSGIGKSTLTNAFVEKGYSFLTDDVAAVRVDLDGTPKVIPSFPLRKLCQDACIHFGYDPGALAIADQSRAKHIIADSERWSRHRKPLGWLVEICPAEPEAGFAVQRVTGHAKLFFLMDALYRRGFHLEMGIAPADMKKLLTIASSVEMLRVYRPHNPELTDALTDFILEQVQTHPPISHQ